MADLEERALLSEDASDDESSRNMRGIHYKKVTENGNEKPAETCTIELAEIDGTERGRAAEKVPGRETTYTVDEAVEQMGFGPFQVLATVFAGLIWVSRERAYQTKLRS